MPLMQLVDLLKVSYAASVEQWIDFWSSSKEQMAKRGSSIVALVVWAATSDRLTEKKSIAELCREKALRETRLTSNFLFNDDC